MASSGSRESLLAHALSFPEAWEDHPWGETVAKVGKKVFAFLGAEDADEAKVTVKLPESREQALDLPGAVPAGYGLGRAGWVMIPIAVVPDGLAEDWIEESFRVIAPKKLSRQLDSQGTLST